MSMSNMAPEGQITGFDRQAHRPLPYPPGREAQPPQARRPALETLGEIAAVFAGLEDIVSRVEKAAGTLRPRDPGLVGNGKTTTDMELGGLPALLEGVLAVLQDHQSRLGDAATALGT